MEPTMNFFVCSFLENSDIEKIFKKLQALKIFQELQKIFFKHKHFLIDLTFRFDNLMELLVFMERMREKKIGLAHMPTFRKFLYFFLHQG